jgi:energy-converting hydrogenase Eha subunit C
MLLSFIVVIVGTVAVIDADQPVAKNEGLWLMVFVLMVVTTLVAAKLFRSK